MKFSTKKNGGQFFFGKKTKPGGGSEGGLVKDHTFPAFFFLHPSLITVKRGNIQLIWSIGCKKCKRLFALPENWKEYLGYLVQIYWSWLWWLCRFAFNNIFENNIISWDWETILWFNEYLPSLFSSGYFQYVVQIYKRGCYGSTSAMVVLEINQVLWRTRMILIC